MAGRRRQGELPGMEAPRITEIENAAELYHRDMTARVAASNKEKVTKKALIDAMKKHGQASYRDSSASPPIMITLKPGKDGVKIDVLEGEGATLGEVFTEEGGEAEDPKGKPKIEKVPRKGLAAVPPAPGDDPH